MFHFSLKNGTRNICLKTSEMVTLTFRNNRKLFFRIHKDAYNETKTHLLIIKGYFTTTFTAFNSDLEQIMKIDVPFGFFTKHII